MILWYTLTTLSGREKGTDMFTENTVWKAVERLIYANGYNDALVNLLNALNIEHDFPHFD